MKNKRKKDVFKNSNKRNRNKDNYLNYNDKQNININYYKTITYSKSNFDLNEQNKNNYSINGNVCYKKKKFDNLRNSFGGKTCPRKFNKCSVEIHNEIGKKQFININNSIEEKDKKQKNIFEENKYLLKFLNKNPSFQINKDNNDKNDINNYIKEEEDFDREFNIIENSNEKFMESNIISKTNSPNKEEKLKLKIDNYFLQKNLSNGMDKSNINNELINEIQSSNGLNNNIDKNNILLKNKINIKITPKKLYSTDSLKNISNNLSLNGTLKTNINSYNQINNNNKKEEELFNKIFKIKNTEEKEKEKK